MTAKHIKPKSPRHLATAAPVLAACIVFVCAAFAAAEAPVSIEYEARLRPGATPAAVHAHFVEWTRRNRAGADPRPGEGLQGVRLILHAACRGVPFGFDRDGLARARVDTGELGAGYHQAVVAALDELMEQFAPDLTVRDPTGYWTGRRREDLVEPMLRRAAFVLEKALAEWPEDPAARLRTPLGDFDKPDAEKWLQDIRRRRRLHEHFVWWGEGRDGAFWTNLGCVLYCHHFLRGDPPPEAENVARTIQRYFDEGRARGRETWLSQYYQGLLELDRGKPEDAAARFGKALEANPGQADVSLALGNARLEAEQPERAAEVFQRLAEAKPGWAEARFRLGMALNMARRWRDALPHLELAAELDPELASAWIERGLALRELGRMDEALASYLKATELAPRNPNAWYGRGAVLLRLERPREAAICLNQCLALAPEHYDALVEMGLARFMEGNMAEAERTFRRATRLAPTRPEAFFNLGRVYEKAGRAEEARRAREEAEKRGYRLEAPVP